MSLFAQITTFSRSQRVLGTGSIVISIALIISLVYSPTSQAVAVATGCYNAFTVGHRGTSAGGVRQNTIAAFKKAVADGAEVVEFDIHRTKPVNGSGQWVINHDAYIQGKKISSYTYDYLKKLQPDLATYRQGLAYLSTARNPSTNALVRVQVEIKPSTVGSGSLKYIANVMKEYGLTTRGHITSFHKEVLSDFNRYTDGVATGLISSSWVSTTTARKYGRIIVLNKAAVTTASQVTTMQSAGVSVYIYTVNSSTEWAKYASYGANGIITDYALSYNQWCAALRT